MIRRPAIGTIYMPVMSTRTRSERMAADGTHLDWAGVDDGSRGKVHADFVASRWASSDIIFCG